MTELLYHQDAYMREFGARVLACEKRDGFYLAELDRTAFYYTSGGQPFDTGRIGGAHVTDVFSENGRVWHKTDRSLAVGSTVLGEIDWDRRFDHMCQHAGEHLVAWAFHEKFSGRTIGLHLGAEISTIDVETDGKILKPSEDEIAAIEGAVMEKILANVPIKCYFPSEDELKTLPLRKAPAVSENVRVVDIGGFEMVACGGTHPAFTGEIGLVKIIECKPNRGKLRVSFVCGMRAYRMFQTLQRESDRACALLSSSRENLSEYVSAALSRQKQAERDFTILQTRALLERRSELLEKARLTAEARVVFACFDGVCEEALRELAAAIAEESDAAALLFSSRNERHIAVFSRGDSVAVHVGNLLKEVFTESGGKGGGKPGFAAGSLPASVNPESIRARLMEGFA